MRGGGIHRQCRSNRRLKSEDLQTRIGVDDHARISVSGSVFRPMHASNKTVENRWIEVAFILARDRVRSGLIMVGIGAGDSVCTHCMLKVSSPSPMTRFIWIVESIWPNVKK